MGKMSPDECGLNVNVLADIIAEVDVDVVEKLLLFMLLKLSISR